MKKIKKVAPKILTGFIAFNSPTFFMGGVLGYFGTKYFIEKNTDFNIILNIKNHKLHLHHWLILPAVLISSVFFDSYLFSSYFFFGFLGGLALQDVHLDPDWKKIIIKNNAPN